MQPPEPKALQYRMGALSLIVVAALSAYLVAATWMDTLAGPLPIPFVVAFLIFNAGYLWAVNKAGFQTTGARLGGFAVALNAATLLLPPVSPIFWTAVSLCAVALAVVGAALLFKEASRAAA